MALTPNTNEAFLREVDEELRRDQLAGFWTRYGRWLIAALIVALIAFGGLLYWRHHQATVAGQDGEALAQAFEALGGGNTAQATAPLARLATSDADGYRTMARFTQADILLQRDDLKGAAARFAEVAGDASLAQPFRDLALIRQTSAEFDQLRPQVVIDRLRALAVPGNPWFGSAGELVAIAYVRMNRRDLAGQLFGRVARDADVPDSLRQRAVQMAGVLGVDAVAQDKGSIAR